MSRIDKALQKAGLVAPDETTSDSMGGTEPAWDLDSIVGVPVTTEPAPEPATTDPEPAEGSAETAPSPALAPPARPERSPVWLPGEATAVSHRDFPGLSRGLHRSFEDKLLATPGMEFQSVEQFRRLAAVLHVMQENDNIKTVLVSSAVPAEGKTLTACNLALCLSGSYHRRVLLVDGDLRRPTMHEMFQVPGASGLSDWLRSDEDRAPAIERVSKHLSVLPAGRPDPDPMGILTSHRMQELLTDASESVDWIVLDSPPVGLLSDGHLLARMADAVILVVRAAHTQHADIQRTIESLGRDRVAGIVLNQVERSPWSNRYSYGYGYDHRPTPTGVSGWLQRWMSRERR